METEPLRLSFFWHMHQPDYRGSCGVMRMPWVFMHAIKDYYEMPWLLSRYPNIKATFNLTATLMEQLDLYLDPLKNDYFLSLWIQHPSMLSDEERTWVIKLCKSSQFDTMVRPIKRYAFLYTQHDYSDDELTDLETLFMLAWCGQYLRSENTVVKELLSQGEGFDQDDKERLLQTLCEFVQTIIPLYASLQEEGRISVSTTPYFHPILPLLIDMENAAIANTHTILPQRTIPLADDAHRHIMRSIALYEEKFMRPPSGFWPAEGAVDPKSVALYRQYGIEWIATDEAILFHSLGSEERHHLYKSYDYQGITIGFRDHTLSDLIGFTYRYKGAEDAAEHFLSSLKSIYETQSEPTVFVIVDGENAWEFYENNGFDFFNALYTRLENTPWCSTATMDEIASQEQTPLTTLHPGSWIHGTFDTWSGHQQKNQAWELIFQTKRDVEHFSGEITEEVARHIEDHFLASECSDWFWWYGDDHVTDYASEFDTLFRAHLVAIYDLLGMAPPASLFIPIVALNTSAPFCVKPSSPLTPVIDGKYTSFFEWLGSGSMDERKLYSTMDRLRGPIDTLYYGHDKRAIYAAFDGRLSQILRQGLKLLVIVEESGERIEYDLEQLTCAESDQVAMEERIEIAISRRRFGEMRRFHLRFELISGSEILQTMPGNGALSIDLNIHYATNWFV
ncbi:glycoside hydrolase family 57 protein [Sulfuricurvum sp.]|uniref:glycoside hydrolase family 57 protein n=1 Tax=Sulfuricurvum sp. TaxID=2025608 RepID=UPI002E370C73|nr:glycoside hydrolase family 57 protein [Sulfuricurvum sp.]HEX5329447.1 glycoside hydrolase family 57 protein [Sulfuricurvum sp.]